MKRIPSSARNLAVGVIVLSLVAPVACAASTEMGSAAQKTKVTRATVASSAVSNDCQREVESLLAQYAEVLSKASKMSDAEFQKTLSRFYRNDTTDDVYFGAASEPLTRGAAAYLANTSATFAPWFKSGHNYSIVIYPESILCSPSLAVAVVTTKGSFSKDGYNVISSVGGATIALEKTKAGWQVRHEHLSQFPRVGDVLSREKLASGQ